MYVNQNTSDQIQDYIYGQENLQHLIGTVGTEGGPCADFVKNLIETATFKQVECPASVFNKDVNLLDRGTLILNAEQLARCATGDILVVVENNIKKHIQKVAHYMLYVNPDIFGETNAIGVNGCYEYANKNPFKGVIAELINANLFTQEGEFHYDSNSQYNLWCIGYNLIN